MLLLKTLQQQVNGFVTNRKYLSQQKGLAHSTVEDSHGIGVGQAYLG